MDAQEHQEATVCRCGGEVVKKRSKLMNVDLNASSKYVWEEMCHSNTAGGNVSVSGTDHCSDSSETSERAAPPAAMATEHTTER